MSSGSSEVEVFTVPSFVGKKYTDLASNQAYTKYVSFLTEHEFSNDYKAGEVMRQSHPQGTQVAVGTVITLTVSDGPETAVMPEVLGRPQADVEADLKALKIKYALYPLVNDGSYVAGTVARSDTDKGTVVEIGKTTVTLYIAGEAPKQPDSSSSSQTAPPAGDSEVTPPPVSSDTTAPSGDAGAGRRNRRRGHARRLTPPHARIKCEMQLIQAAPRNQRFRALLRVTGRPARCRAGRNKTYTAAKCPHSPRSDGRGSPWDNARTGSVLHGCRPEMHPHDATEQADTVRYLGSNPLYGAQRRVRFRIGHGAQCIQPRPPV